MNSRESSCPPRPIVDSGADDERFVRWNGRAMVQFGVAIAMISALSVSAIGAGLALLEREEFNVVGAHGLSYALSLLILVAAIFLSLLAATSRLLDFRLTARVVRGRPDTRLFGLDKDQFSNLSWGLLWASFIALLIGGGFSSCLSLWSIRSSSAQADD